MDTSQLIDKLDHESVLLERYRNLAQISTDWFWETDANYIVIYMSESVERVTGLPRETYIGMSRFDLASEETKKTLSWQRHLEQVQNHEPIKNFEYKHVGPDGHVVYLRVNAIPLFQEDGSFRGYLGTTADISELVMAKNRLEDANAKLLAKAEELETAKQEAELLARTDALTGLNNRRSFFEKAQANEEIAKRYKQPYSVIMMDIDHFKSINDTFGHTIGDEALKAVADVLRTVNRTSDITGRIGGEEFAIVLPQTGQDKAMILAERLRIRISEVTVETDQGPLTFTSSFGVSDSTESFADFDEVMARADEALYLAKEQGRNQVVLKV